ncbi:MAG: Asp-tRNA(Asn)/Glu-tRNA(Gln) amidotransferase subunit GatC [Candidatus Saccharibacteria bacterium]|nr:Asp-tRNA(Asn)/Glu-tRNA(Gln) amidotransferase subunit GatC [Candidatus Saccharibacteria bacterium]
MKVESDTVLHLADLSNFSISDAENKSLQKDLDGILKYISQLDEIDIDEVEPTYQVFEMENVWRDDEILPQDASRDELLALAKEQKDNQIKVPKVL